MLNDDWSQGRTASNRNRLDSKSVHMDFLTGIHPKRVALRLLCGQKIAAAATAYLPPPRDLGAELLKARSGRTVPSPSSCHVTTDFSLEEFAALKFNSASPERKAAEKKLRRAKVLVGGEAIALYGAGIFEKLHAVDTHVYETMSRLSGENLDNLASLSRQFSGWDHNVWTGLPMGGLSKLSGHLGEVLAAGDLQQAGAHVVWPDASNQQGWDLLIDGHTVNVKTVADASELAAHFKQFPEIPVLIPGDAAHIPADAFHFDPTSDVSHALSEYLAGHHDRVVLVDDALSHHDVASQALDASDAALGGTSLVDMHIPWLTLALSGSREWRLLAQSHTDLQSAGKNLGLDVAGRGGGAFLGAKLGALTLSVFGPVGSILGALFGGLGGALLGNEVATEIKRQPLLKARDAAQFAKSALTDAGKQCANNAQRSFEAMLDREAASLRRMAVEERTRISALASHLTAQVRQSAFLSPKAAILAVRQAVSELAAYRRALHNRLIALTFFKRYLWPDAEVIAMEQACELLDQWAARLQTLLRSADQGQATFNRGGVLAMLAGFGVAAQFIDEQINTTKAEHKELEHRLRQQIKRSGKLLASERVSATKRLANHSSELLLKMQRELRPHVARQTEALRALCVELQKLGHAR